MDDHTASNGWATTRDLERAKPLIGCLYRTRTLREVMHIMKTRYGIRATENMYKKRINKWGLERKNHKQIAIVHKNKRPAVARPSVCEVHDHKVVSKNVLQSCERKTITVNEVAGQGRSSEAMPERLEHLIAIPSLISSPTVLKVLENILKKVRDYDHASFDMGTWVLLDPILGCTTSKGSGDSAMLLSEANSQIMTASHLISINRFQEAGRTLISGTACIDRILRAEDPMTLPNLMALVTILYYRRQHEVGMAIMRYTAALGEVILGQEHPIPKIVGMLTALDSEQLRHVVMSALSAICHDFEHKVGWLNRSTLKIRWIQRETAERMQNRKTLAAALRCDLQMFDNVLGAYDIRSMSVKMWLAAHLFETMQYVEAERYSRDLLAYAGGMEFPSDKVKFRAEGFYFLGKVKFAIDELGFGERCMTEAIRLRLSYYGMDDGRARAWSVDLQKQFFEHGHSASAARVEQWRASKLRFKEPD